MSHQGGLTPLGLSTTPSARASNRTARHLTGIGNQRQPMKTAHRVPLLFRTRAMCTCETPRLRWSERALCHPLISLRLEQQLPRASLDNRDLHLYRYLPLQPATQVSTQVSLAVNPHQRRSSTDHLATKIMDRCNITRIPHLLSCHKVYTSDLISRLPRPSFHQVRQQHLHHILLRPLSIRFPRLQFPPIRLSPQRTASPTQVPAANPLSPTRAFPNLNLALSRAKSPPSSPSSPKRRRRPRRRKTRVKWLLR